MTRDRAPLSARRAAALRRCWAGTLIVVAIAAGGCQRSDELAILASARRHLDAEDHAAAVLELKTVLQTQPKSPDVRYLLGKALLATGDPGAAEAEFRRARELGHADAEIQPALASVLLARQRPEQVIAQYAQSEPADAAAYAELRTHLALAYAETGKLDLAQRTLDAVLQRSAAHLPARLLAARLAAARGDHDAARRIAGELKSSHGNDALVWTLHGDLLQAAATEGAEAAYRRALELRPRLLAAHAGLLTQLIGRGDLPAARQQLAALSKALPDSSATIYFEAVVAYLGGDARHTRALMQRLLAISPDTPQLLVLSALAEARLGSDRAARAYLEKAVSLALEQPEPRLELARLHLRGGQGARALETLRPLIGAGDAEALTLAAQAQLLTGETAAAEQSLARAAALKPGDPDVRTARARSLLARGQLEPGLRELQAAAAADAAGGEADLLLVTARLRRQETAAALAAVEALARKQPQAALPEYLRGHIATLQRDAKTARAAFDAALAKQPGYPPALARLAGLDLDENQPQLARARYESVLASRPDDVDAMLALAAFLRRSGAAPAETAAWLTKAARVRPHDARTWLGVVDRALAWGDAAAARTLAAEAAKALPEQPEVQHRLAAAQLAAGAPQQAIETLGALTKKVAPSPPLHLLLARAHLAAGDPGGARLQIQSALALAPDWPDALRAGVELSLRRGRPEEALTLAREVQSRQPGDALGHLLEGDVLAQRKDWGGAAAAFRKALDKRAPGDAAVRLHWALLRGGAAAAANAFEQEWRRRQPADTLFLNHLGEAALLRNDTAAADAAFRKVLEVDPDDVSALNNRALLLVRGGRAAQGLPLAEQAARLAPEQADVLDTLAAAWAASGRRDLALAWQQRAVALAPQAPGLRLTLARLYLDGGDHAKAREQLQPLARLGKTFSAAPEVQRLLKAAGG